jgi:hypothetical protein
MRREKQTAVFQNKRLADLDSFKRNMGAPAGSSARIREIQAACGNIEPPSHTDLKLDGRKPTECTYGQCARPHKGNGFCTVHQPPAEVVKAAVTAAKQVLEWRRANLA